MSQMNTMAKGRRRMKHMVTDLGTQADLLREALEKITLPAERRTLAETAVATRGDRIALSCRAFGVSVI